MDPFQKRTALRIALVSFVLASLASPIAWMVTREAAEESVVALASEESGRLLHRFNSIDLSGPDAPQHAKEAASAIAGGLFDIAEIYDAKGNKLAESLTAEGDAVESLLPQHGAPSYTQASYESLKPSADLWLLRVFVPLRNSTTDPNATITGYFEGVRVIPSWQQSQIFTNSLTMALMVGLASLLCGAALYPVMVHLSADNVRKAREVLESHIAMMEALGRAIAKRDSDTGAHNYRVAWIAARIGEEMDLRGSDMQALIVGSFLHDVGKIGIPRRHPAQTWTTRRHRDDHHAHPCGAGRKYRGRHWLAGGGQCRGGGPPRKMERHWLPAQPGGRCHPAGSPHLRRGRRV